MAASPSIEPPARDAGLLLDEKARSLLLDLADAAVVAGLDGNLPGAPDLALLPPVLREPSGVFATLRVSGELNGCVGSVVAREPLAVGAARYSWAAAFDDPRLPRLRWRDYDHLVIEISVLSPLRRVPAGSRAELVAALRPGIDGLYLTCVGGASAFLPSVWEQLPDADEFVRRLQLKAGLSPGWWPPDMKAYRFTATKFGCRAGRDGDAGRSAGGVSYESPRLVRPAAAPGTDDVG